MMIIVLITVVIMMKIVVVVADDYGCKNGGDEAKTLSAKGATLGKIFLLKKLKEQTHKGKTSPDRKIK